MACLFCDKTHFPLFWLGKEKGLTHYPPAHHSRQQQPHQQDTQSLAPVIEPWTGELLWFSPKDSGKGKCSTRTQIQSPGTDKNRKRNGTKTKLKPSGYHLYNNRDHNIKSTTMPSTGRKVIAKAKHDHLWSENKQRSLEIIQTSRSATPQLRSLPAKKDLSHVDRYSDKGGLSQEFFKLKGPCATTQQCLQRDTGQPCEGMPSKS